MSLLECCPNIEFIESLGILHAVGQLYAFPSALPEGGV